MQSFCLRSLVIVMSRTNINDLAGNINTALERLEYIKEQSCIMPECPYCPSCVYGFVIYPEEAYEFPEEDCSTEWRCLLDVDERVVEKGLEEGGTA